MSEAYSLHTRYQFRVGLSSDGFDVLRSVRGNSQHSLVVMSYPNKEDADHLVETLRLLEMRRRLRLQVQRRNDAQHSR